MRRASMRLKFLKIRGERVPVSPECVRVCFIYLDQQLETVDERALVAVVAHELAHVISGDIMGDEAERKADQMIREWGFDVELDKLREINPGHRF
jgi:hypothetical protein